MYKVAGIVFEAGECGSAFCARAGKYLVPCGEPEFTLTITDAEAAACSAPVSADSARYMLSGTKFYIELIERGGMMLHSSAVALNGRAYLFSGPSGVGKSTHTRHWLSLYPEAYILNDDKPALRLEGGGVTAYGTPWSGKHDISRNEGLPVGGIAFIERASENRIELMSPREAAAALISQTVRHIRRDRMETLLETVVQVVGRVPVWRLGCIDDKSAAELSSRAMMNKVFQ